MAKKINSFLAARLHNPLLLWNGLNAPPQESKIDPKYAQIQSLYEEALKQTSTRNLTMGLEVDYSDTDQGLGGFYNAGYIPEFFSNLGLRKNESERDFKFYWPKDYHTGKYMHYLASINLGNWPLIFANLTKFQLDKWNELSFYGGRELGDKSSLFFASDY